MTAGRRMTAMLTQSGDGVTIVIPHSETPEGDRESSLRLWMRCRGETGLANVDDGIEMLKAMLGVLRSRRGGDPLAQQRRDRDGALRVLAREMYGDGKLDEQQTREILAKAKRYRPSADAPPASPVRLQLHRIAASGLSLPGLRQAMRIVNGKS
jgi:hypothetical protein